MEVSSHLHAPAALPRGKTPVPIGSQSQFGRGGEEKKNLPCPSLESNLGPPALTVLTELLRL